MWGTRGCIINLGSNAPLPPEESPLGDWERGTLFLDPKMLSGELVQGSPAGASASFPDGVPEGGGGGIFVREMEDRGMEDDCGSGSLFFGVSLLPCLPSRRRLTEETGEGERRPLPGAPEYCTTAPHLPFGRRGRNSARAAQHAGAGRPRRPAGERRAAGGGPWLSPATPNVLRVALETRCTG